MTMAVIANLVMASFCHAHGEAAESSSRPHIHFGTSDHAHDHGHGHGHDHSHHHHGNDHHHDNDQNDAPEKDNSICDQDCHDSDAVYFSSSEIIPSQTSPHVEKFSTTLGLPSELRSSHRPADSQISRHVDSPRVAAHALILKKIRLLL